MLRLEKTLEYLKETFREAGREYKTVGPGAKNKELLNELHGLTSAINAIEVHLYDKSLTVITDCLE